MKVALPSTPYDLKGLFKTALREPGPVVLIEHKSLYNTKGVVPEEEYLIPFGDARIVREGKDLTIVAMSRMVDLATKAAAVLAKEGISAEVIDPRTIVPLDRKKITNSIKKTGRLVVIDESPSYCSFAGGASWPSQWRIASTSLTVTPKANLFVGGPKSVQPGSGKSNDSFGRAHRQRSTRHDETVKEKVLKMAYKIVMPQLGLTMEEGSVTSWLKTAGRVR